MGNNEIFKALSSQTRLRILKILINRESHISELARSLDISVPVMSRHVKLLEKTGLIKKRIVGNVHLLSANIGSFEDVLEPFIEESVIEINKNESLLDALRQLPNIEVRRIDDNQYITSIDGEKGHYIYEVNGELPEIPIDEYKPKKNVTLELKKLVSVNKKKIDVNLKKQD